jgi:transcription initiation factor TFIIIB Brf1 subunit/transcription initiation factor TFIIB
LAKLQNKSALSSNHRALLDAFRKSSRISSLLSLPQSITDRANELYKKILDSKTMRPRGADTLIVTCLFMVCKAERVPRTIKEMCGVSEVAQKELGKCFKEIKRLGFHKTLTSTRGGGAGHTSDNDEDDEYRSYVARWGNQIRLQPKLIEAAQTIAQQARDVLRTARDPGSTCGAALYIASQFGTIQDRKSLASTCTTADTYERRLTCLVWIGQHRPLLTTLCASHCLSPAVIAAVVSISPNTIRSVVQAIIAEKAKILPAEYITASIVVE